MPPISACEDDDGTPNHQVTRFQAIAPTRPAKITVVVTTPASTMPFATVAATVIEMKAPAKFSIAAMPTATRGFSAPVAIVVAIAFAVSWKPLVKSKTSATDHHEHDDDVPRAHGAESIGPRGPSCGARSQLDHDLPARARFDFGTMGDNVIPETRERLEARLAELRPQVEEAAKIEAALAALKTARARR